MVPEDQPEGAAERANGRQLKAPKVRTQVRLGNNWADLSDGILDTAAASLEQQDLPEELPELGPGPAEGEELGGEGAAFGAPGEVSEFDHPPRFDALSLLDPVKQEDEQVSAEQIFQELEADPAELSSSVIETPIEAEENTNLEVNNPEIDNIQILKKVPRFLSLQNLSPS